MYLNIFTFIYMWCGQGSCAVAWVDMLRYHQSQIMSWWQHIDVRTSGRSAWLSSNPLVPHRMAYVTSLRFQNSRKHL